MSSKISEFSTPSKNERTLKKKNKPSSEPMGCFFMAAAMAIYVRDETQKSRHMNVLLQSDSPNLTKADLGTLNRTVLHRLREENQVNPEEVKDVVFLNISFLGQMPVGHFHGVDANTPATDTPQ